MTVVVIVTTDTNRVYLPMDFSQPNLSLPLEVNSKSPFTLHYALWPFIGLLFLIAFVWILVYVSTLIARRRRSKAADQRNFASYYVTQDSTIAGGYEISNTVSAVNV